MKEGIHPNYQQTTITCACGNVIETGSTKANIKVEVCSKCHPYFTDKHHAVARLLHGFEFVFFHRNHLFCVSFLQYTQGNEKCKEKEVCFRRPLSQFLLVQTELLVELGNAAAGIDQLLLAREVGVTL